MAYRSPPGPQLIGSMRPMAALVAMAASTAFPPRLRISRPICAACGCVVATIPCSAMVSAAKVVVAWRDIRITMSARVGRGMGGIMEDKETRDKAMGNRSEVGFGVGIGMRIEQA